MKVVYEVISINLQVNEKSISIGFYETIIDAFDVCVARPGKHDAKDVVEDFTGSLESYNDHDLDFKTLEKPAVYYTSHYGNYPCAYYVETHEVKPSKYFTEM